MTHNTNLNKIDLLIGVFYYSMSTRVNQVMYIIFAFIFTYQDIGISFEHIGAMEIVQFIFFCIFYLLFISIFIFLASIVYVLFSSGLKEGVLGEHQFEFGDENFVEKTQYNESVHNYKSVSDVKTLFGNIYIFLSGGHWHVLPKRGFDNEKDRFTLLKFILEKK